MNHSETHSWNLTSKMQKGKQINQQIVACSCPQTCPVEHTNPSITSRTISAGHKLCILPYKITVVQTWNSCFWKTRWQTLPVQTSTPPSDALPTSDCMWSTRRWSVLRLLIFRQYRFFFSINPHTTSKNEEKTPQEFWGPLNKTTSFKYLFILEAQQL